jgi:hypothetical protein
MIISGLTAISQPARAATLTELTVDGTELSAGQLYGVDDTTLLQFAILAYIEGNTQYKGMNQNFPGPGGTITPNYESGVMFHQYFAICAEYNINLVRIGAGDKWGSQIQFEAWLNHHDAFISLIETMARQAADHGVYICLVLGAAQEWPVYQYGGSGVVFEIGSTAYSNYITYCRDTMAALDDEVGIGMWDLMNEPDYDQTYNGYWSSHGGKAAFNAWAKAVAADTASARTKPRTMGTAGQGLMFGFSQSDFNLATGTCGFEILHRHYYASAQDSYLFADPESWADACGKPLLWGELGNNGGGMYIRWSWAEQQIYASGGTAICTMVLGSMDGYPYSGGSLVDASSVDQTGSDIDGAVIGVLGTGAGAWPYVIGFTGVSLILCGVAFRRSCLRDLYFNGMPLPEIQRFAGHQKLETTIQYLGLKDSDLDASVDKYQPRYH